MIEKTILKPRPLVLAVFAALNLANAAYAALPFTAGNVVIYRVGTGSAMTSGAATAVFLDEYTPGGTLVQSIAMPTATSGANKILTASSTATSEGLLTRSSDGNYLVLAGYNTATGTANVTGTTSASVNRVVGVVNNAGAVDTSTALTDAATGNNIRSATSTNGTDLWVTGAAGGIGCATLDGTTSTQLSTTVTNLRQANIFNGQLYISDNSGSAVRLGTVGSGTPTASGQTIANLPGFATSTGSPYGFFFADLTASVAGVDTLYVADDGIGITKYSLVSGSWTSNGTVGAAADTYRGLTATVSGTSVTLFATGLGGSSTSGGGKLVTITDSSRYNAAFSGTPTTLVTAATNTAFRGVALAPVAPVTPTVNLSVSSNTDTEAGQTVITVTATASSAVSGSQTVNLAVSGTGITAGDYTLSNT